MLHKLIVFDIYQKKNKLKCQIKAKQEVAEINRDGKIDSGRTRSGAPSTFN